MPQTAGEHSDDQPASSDVLLDSLKRGPSTYRKRLSALYGAEAARIVRQKRAQSAVSPRLLERIRQVLTKD